jgi:hypothetical protein
MSPRDLRVLLAVAVVMQGIALLFFAVRRL